MENNLYSSFRLRRLRRKRKNRIRFLLLIIGIIIAYIVYGGLVKNNVTDQAKRATPWASRTPLPDISNPDSFKAGISLQNTVEKSLEGARGTYAVAIKNLKNGKSYYINEHKVFEAGSLYKLWIMVVVYQQIQDGRLTGDQVLSKDIAVLNQEFNIDPDSAEQTQGAITLTVNDALKQMITISHNYAALLLTEKVKLSSVAAFLKTNGFSGSIVGTNGDSPTVTASDVVLFFEKLYKGEFANQQYTQEMIDLLKKQQLNDGLPKYLPQTSKVAHKTGDIGWFKHDAGIVFIDDQNSKTPLATDYIIVVMSESDNPPGAQERIALLSKAVFDYFQVSKN